MRRVVVAVLSVVLLSCVSVRAEGFYRCSGQDILAPDGGAFLMRGNALSHWLNPEAYALKLNLVHNRHIGSPGSIQARIREIVGEADADAFWAAYRAKFVTEQDIADMAAEGFNTIRVPFNYRLISPEGTPGVYSEAGFQQLDTVIQWCKSAGLAVLLDLHAAPGGQSHDGYADPEFTYWAWDDGITNWLEHGVACLWQFEQGYFDLTGRTPESNQQRTVDLWREIANRYKDEPAIIGYELLNEPFLPYGVHWPALRDLLVRITAAIREVDTNHIVFVEGNYFAGTMEGLVPPWDPQTVLCFHRYWTTNDYGTISNFVETAQAYGLPLCMTESGENSNPWFRDAVSLLESHGVGWCWWGYKKVGLIASAFSADVTTDYQYVIDNFRDLPIDPARAKKGLMECATNLATARCDFDPGWYDALLNPLFASQSYAFVGHALPCKIYAVDYDVGNNGVAYLDARWQNTEGYNGAPYNSGYNYRNDGVDIAKTAEGNGYKVGWIENGEKLAFSVTVPTAGKYDIVLRTASPSSTGRLQVYVDGAPLTAVLSVPRSGGWESWKSTTVKGFTLGAGAHVIETRFPVGGFDFASIEFKKSR